MRGGVISRGSKYSDLTWKLLVAGLGSCRLREVVAFGDSTE